MRVNPNFRSHDYCFSEPDSSSPQSHSRPDAPSVAAVTAADGAPVEQYDREVFEIVMWAQRGGWLCCQACGAYGPYQMVDGRALCHLCLREDHLFTFAEHAASEREAARELPSHMELEAAVRGTPYEEVE